MVYDFKVKNIQNRFKSEFYLSEIENVLEKKDCLIVENLLDYLTSELSKKINIIINKDFIPLLKIYMKNTNVDWYEYEENENIYIRYTENRDNKVNYTVGSLLSYSIKEVDLEKILWKKIEDIMNEKIFEQHSGEIFKIEISNMPIYNKIRSHYLHSIFFQFKNIYIVDLIEKKSLEIQSKKNNTSHIMIEISNLIFNEQEKNITIISYDNENESKYFIDKKNNIEISSQIIKDLLQVVLNGGYILLDIKSNMSLAKDKDIYIRRGVEINNRKIIRIDKESLKKSFYYKEDYKIIFDDFKD
jgi:hypothetical protein